jgi:hypothetical protein
MSMMISVDRLPNRAFGVLPLPRALGHYKRENLMNPNGPIAYRDTSKIA